LACALHGDRPVSFQFNKESMTFKIQRTEDVDHVVFNLSGRMVEEQVAELQGVFGLEVRSQNLILDLKEESASAGRATSPDGKS
jgi:hypothetical protein